MSRTVIRKLLRVMSTRVHGKQLRYGSGTLYYLKIAFQILEHFFLSLTAYLLLKANVALDKNLQHFKTALTFLQTLLVQLVGMATTVVWNAVATVLMIIPVFIRTEVA